MSNHKTYLKHRKKYIETAKKRYYENREEILKKRKIYYLKNLVAIRKRNKIYYDKTHPNVGKYYYKVERICKFCKKIFYVKPAVAKIGHGIFCSYKCCGLGRDEKTNNKISIAKKGKHYSPKTEFQKGSIPWNKGKKRTDMNGDKHPFWKGGVTPIHEKIRKSFEYKDWRDKVFKRDKYTCLICGKRSQKKGYVYLHADHIKPFSIFPELRFDISNGRTLCKDCHRKTPTWGVNLLTKNIYERYQRN